MTDDGWATVKEWRICGDTGPMGPWHGAWRQQEPTRNDVYDLAQYQKRGNNAWVEWRTVSVSPISRSEGFES